MDAEIRCHRRKAIMHLCKELKSPLDTGLLKFVPSFFQPAEKSILEKYPISQEACERQGYDSENDIGYVVIYELPQLNPDPDWDQCLKDTLKSLMEDPGPISRRGRAI
ncbi:hypothetical protein NUU61_008234 [Penicillium alfredii]|uniref:Uncharacterized protein n=1 Tax=Penicillium alfredii TaxID=1506179 RepID=A0A9W9JZU7_9EURO|nr:uncharacterized protein NUU61_008234 [Penicillium alfredii]KAJ5086927.1 hypothetical protein NUU61_008234 [Penicillium alfredii]